MTKRTLSVIATTLAITLLAGCGGGGDAPSNTEPTPNPTPAAEDSSIAEAIQTPTYSTSSEEYAAFQLLNRERVRCGFGSLAQNTQLDQAARGHVDWMLLNSVYSHYQSSSYPLGFTGTTPTDRAALAGYTTSYGVGEGIAFGDNGSKLGRGEVGVRELLAGVYHAIGVLQPMKEVGISVREPADVGRTTVIVPTEIVISSRSGYQLLPTDTVATYPCEGTSNARNNLGLEEPNPVPGRNLSTQPLGPSITVMVRRGNNLTLTDASMHRVSDNQVVTLRSPVTEANDPHGQLNGLAHIGYVLPDGPLDANTQYRVSVRGTNNGVAFQRVFTFTTGS